MYPIQGSIGEHNPIHNVASFSTTFQGQSLSKSSTNEHYENIFFVTQIKIILHINLGFRKKI